MNTMNELFRILAVVLFSLIATTSRADNMAEIGDYVVHYNAFTSDTLSPEMARLYNITRSKNRAVLNVVVLKKKARGALGEPVEAEVTGTATNLNGQLKRLSIRQVRERNSKHVYHISEIKVNNGETLDFVLNIRPEGGKNHTIRFRQQFFTR